MCSIIANHDGSLYINEGITAGFLAHTAMKLLLDYEDVSLHLQYNAKKEYFKNSVYPPNPDCKDRFCLDRQRDKADKKGFLAARKERHEAKAKAAIAPVQQNKEEVDKWGIELMENEESQESGSKIHTISKEETDGTTLDSLMSQLKDM